MWQSLQPRGPIDEDDGSVIEPHAVIALTPIKRTNREMRRMEGYLWIRMGEYTYLWVGRPSNMFVTYPTLPDRSQFRKPGRHLQLGERAQLGRGIIHRAQRVVDGLVLVERPTGSI